METIKVNVEWIEKNFCAALSDNVPGSVVITARDINELKKEITDTLRFHVDGMLRDGYFVPQWLITGDYTFDYNYVDVASLLHACEPYAKMAALSRVTGINQRLLSHYANGVRNPRPAQRKRIAEGIHEIGRELLSVC